MKTLLPVLALFSLSASAAPFLPAIDSEGGSSDGCYQLINEHNGHVEGIFCIDNTDGDASKPRLALEELKVGGRHMIACAEASRPARFTKMRIMGNGLLLRFWPESGLSSLELDGAVSNGAETGRVTVVYADGRTRAQEYHRLSGHAQLLAQDSVNASRQCKEAGIRFR